MAESKRLITPKELAVEVTRGTLEGLAESFEHEHLRGRRFSGRQIATLLRRTAEGLPDADLSGERPTAT